MLYYQQFKSAPSGKGYVMKMGKANAGQTAQGGDLWQR